MAIQPIDIQTLFAKLNQVSKEQAELKDISDQHQALQNSEIVKQADKKSHTVMETEGLADGPDKTDEDGRKKQEAETSPEAAVAEEKKDGNKEKDKPYFQDPDLGHHVDLTG